MPRWCSAKSVADQLGAVPNDRLMRALFALSMLTLSACATPTVLEPKDYTLTCERDADCVAVYLGEVCKPCICDNAAINVLQRNIYNADFTGAQRSCSSIPTEECAGCAPLTVSCDNGTCTAK